MAGWRYVSIELTFLHRTRARTSNKVQISAKLANIIMESVPYLHAYMHEWMNAWIAKPIDASQTRSQSNLHFQNASRWILENSAIGFIASPVFSVRGRSGNAMYPEDLHLITREWWITSRYILLHTTEYVLWSALLSSTPYTSYTTFVCVSYCSVDRLFFLDLDFRILCFSECVQFLWYFVYH